MTIEWCWGWCWGWCGWWWCRWCEWCADVAEADGVSFKGSRPHLRRLKIESSVSTAFDESPSEAWRCRYAEDEATPPDPPPPPVGAPPLGDLTRVRSSTSSVSKRSWSGSPTADGGEIVEAEPPPPAAVMPMGERRVCLPRDADVRWRTRDVVVVVEADCEDEPGRSTEVCGFAVTSAVSGEVRG